MSVLGTNPILIPSFLGGFSVPSASLSTWMLFMPLYFAATMTDTVIDMLGHRRKPGAPFATRTATTHTTYTAPIFGGLVGAGVGTLFIFVSSFLALPNSEFWEWTLAAGIIASYCHLVADSCTLGGIFLTASRRFRLLHLNNNNPVWCLSLVSVGLFGIVQGLGLWSPFFSLLRVVGL